MTTTRRLAAILAADVAGYSRLMAANEVGTLAALKALRREVVDPDIAEHHGRIVKTTGDGMLVEFASAVDAVTCAMAVQEAMAARGGAIVLRIGINVGDIIIDGDDIFGDGVNVAARVESECEPGSVCVSANAFEQLRNKTPFLFNDLGEKALKNIDRPVRIFAVRAAGATSASLAATEPRKPLPLPDKPSIAVLPFLNMSGDPEQEYFADGMVEDIITALSRFKSLFVIARNSSFTYKGRAVDIKQVGRELGVRYVLEGSVRKAGGRVRITGQLIEASTGAHLWADRFDGALEDVFDLQDNVTSCVVGAIAPRLLQADLDQRKRKAPSSLDSYEYYMRGMMFRNQRAFAHAVPLFRKATEIDPLFGLAYAKAAWSIWAQQNITLQPIPEVERLEAIDFAEKAIRLAGDDAEAVVSTVWVFEVLANDNAKAALLADRAVELNPNLSQAWNVHAWMSGILGEHKRALQEFARALRLNPLDPVMVPNIFWGNATICGLLGQHEEAIAWAEKILTHRPNDFFGLFALAKARTCLGRRDEARQLAARIRELHPNARAGYFRNALPSRFHRREDRTAFALAVDMLELPE